MFHCIINTNNLQLVIIIQCLLRYRRCCRSFHLLSYFLSSDSFSSYYVIALSRVDSCNASGQNNVSGQSLKDLRSPDLVGSNVSGQSLKDLQNLGSIEPVKSGIWVIIKFVCHINRSIFIYTVHNIYYCD